VHFSNGSLDGRMHFSYMLQQTHENSNENVKNAEESFW
jgi:hypothetical protein